MPIMNYEYTQSRTSETGNIILQPLGDLESDLRAQDTSRYIYDIYYHGSAPEQQSHATCPDQSSSE